MTERPKPPTKQSPTPPSGKQERDWKILLINEVVRLLDTTSVRTKTNFLADFFLVGALIFGVRYMPLTPFWGGLTAILSVAFIVGCYIINYSDR